MSLEKYSIVIPVRTMEGNPYLENILDALAKQTYRPEAVHLVVGDKRQGRAINYGVQQVLTKYIGTVDDDTEIDDPKLYEKLIKAMEADVSIGMGGAACPIPEHASNFQKKAIKEIPRRFFPVQYKNIDSDIVQHPCLVMPTKLFRAIDGEDEELIRGLDPVLRQKVRDAGKRVTVIADTWVYHLIPDSFVKLLIMYYRNGRGSGFAGKYYPEKILELTDGCKKDIFKKKRSLFYRILRRFLRLFSSLLKLKSLKFSTDIAYSAGVIKERMHPDYVLEPPEIEEIKMREKKNYPYKLFVHDVFLKEKNKN
ncbi:MAG: glycosyltransferase [Verrucomicrobiota bacterium]|nr:glycosyltransferase [Verrucomicrobiota bacterium]